MALLELRLIGVGSIVVCCVGCFGWRIRFCLMEKGVEEDGIKERLRGGKRGQRGVALKYGRLGSAFALLSSIRICRVSWCCLEGKPRRIA